jgi:methylmalonyl-CoA mutase C-terminal domain/subunit
MAAPLRIVVAKPGLDGHDRGAKVIARALRDAGHEVIYTGLHQTPEQIVETAIQEDADVIGLSVLSGAHMTLFKKLIALLAERDASDIVVIGGGIIPDGDIPLLKEMGVAEVFTPGAPTTRIVEWVRDNVVDDAPVQARRSGPDGPPIGYRSRSGVVSGIRSVLGCVALVVTVTGCGARFPA